MPSLQDAQSLGVLSDPMRLLRRAPPAGQGEGGVRPQVGTDPDPQAARTWGRTDNLVLQRDRLDRAPRDEALGRRALAGDGPPVRPSMDLAGANPFPRGLGGREAAEASLGRPGGTRRGGFGADDGPVRA